MASPRRLNPTTPLNTKRYDTSACAQPCPRVITRGPATHNRSTSSPSKWKRFIHPEGQRYFVLDGQFAFNIVTEADIEDVQTQGRILDCVTFASQELYCHNIKVSSRCELLLELGDDQASCNYYFVDHIGKVLFWLEDLCSDLLDIEPAVSSSHLNTQLENLYWTYVEFFPMHHEPQEQHFSHMLDNLYNIISHGQADRLTSKTSTFPYTADTCQHFLKLLFRKRGQRADGYTLCYAARLARAIANQRFVTFYGQQPAQLDRLQEMFTVDVPQHKWLSDFANLFMWGIPLDYTSLLDGLYVNERVYADQWTRFMSNCLADWTTCLSWSPPVFIASILLANVRGGTVSTSILPALLSAVSIASASCLHLRHQPLAESSAGVGARYLSLAKSSTLGFLPSSVAFSLPRASYLWGVGLLTAQFLFVASRAVNRLVALVAACVVVGMMAFVIYVIYPEEARVSFPSLLSSLSFCVPCLHAVSDAPESELMV